MHDGIELVRILDSFLKERGISRRQFCALADIPESTIATWKHKNILPTVEIIVKVAKFMNVSLDWLVYGELLNGADKNNTLENPYSRQNIIYRIEIQLRNKDNDTDYDLESLHKKYLSDIVDYEILQNWVDGRTYLSQEILQRIAERLGVSLYWLLTNKDEDETNAYICGLAKTYPNLLKGFHSLDKGEQKFIDDYIATKLKNRRLERENETLKQELNKK